MNQSSLTYRKKFTIKDLERFSGIKAHTLRIWEQRYPLLLEPQRTETNFRFYTIKDLKRVLDVSILNRAGIKISQLSTMHDDEIERRIRMLSNDKDRFDVVINRLVIYMHLLDHTGFESTLNECLEKMSLDTLLKKIIFPFLEKSMLLWQGKQINEEHLVVTAIRNKIILGIEKVKPAAQKDKTILLFLPDGKQLDLLLLYTYYLQKAGGIQVLFLGNHITVANLKEVFSIKRPDFAFTYLPQKNHFPLDELSEFMRMHSPQSTLVVTLYPFEEEDTTSYSNVVFLNFEAAMKYVSPAVPETA